MTTAEIRTAPAGPELDRIAADVVMGWVNGVRHGESVTAYPNGRLVATSAVTAGGDRIDFAPSREITHAWELVELITNPMNGLYVVDGDLSFPAATVFMHWWNGANLWADTAPDASLCITRAAIICAMGERP